MFWHRINEYCCWKYVGWYRTSVDYSIELYIAMIYVTVSAIQYVSIVCVCVTVQNNSESCMLAKRNGPESDLSVQCVGERERERVPKATETEFPISSLLLSAGCRYFMHFELRLNKQLMYWICHRVAVLISGCLAWYTVNALNVWLRKKNPKNK